MKTLLSRDELKCFANIFKSLKPSHSYNLRNINIFCFYFMKEHEMKMGIKLGKKNMKKVKKRYFGFFSKKRFIIFLKYSKLMSK